METSHSRKYNEMARLNSPLKKGAQHMTFFYAMIGGTVESLSVYVRINGGEERIWSHHGNYLSSNWTKGCVALDYNGTYQIIIEGVAGMTLASNIAVDDITFSTNLTCVSVGKPTPPETFEVNCTFDESYCGWRNMLTSPNDQISWHRKRSGNQSQGTGPSQDHTGSGQYIYVDESQSLQVNQPAQLLSPLIRGPKCLRFYYYMNGSDIGNLDLLLWPREQQDSYLIWRRSGEQGDVWLKASVDVGYTNESRFSFEATIGRNCTGGIALDDVTLSNGLCEGESDPQNNRQGNCNFDSSFCLWKNDLLFSFIWTQRRYTPSWETGPSADHTSGTGIYIHIETFYPRLPGDSARLESPWMRGPQCMTFFYHMFGSTMSRLVIYTKSHATNKLKPVWLRSQDQGDHWIQGQISINETSSYQIIIDGIRGSSYKGDVALDDVSFERGHCDQTGNCSFDQNTLCSWSNDHDIDHFDWQLRRGSSQSNNTRPTSDHSGNGLYVYMETSHSRKYNEKARLNSPLKKGAQRMTFFYSMIGRTVESLSVYVIINGSEERIWSRHGNYLSSNWTKGCVTLDYNGTYQIIIEGVAGMTFASNIAIDDITFSTNLTCVSVGKPTPPETFEVTCTFDESYCGWRNILTSPNDQISWHRKRSGNQSQGTGPSQDHTGSGQYIHLDESQSSQVNQPAQLLSPLIRGPKCLRFYYYMNGSDIGNLDLLLWPREQQDSYLIWQGSGEQGDMWLRASVDVGYTSESRFSFEAKIGRNYTGGIAVDDITLSNGLCDGESEPQNNQQGNCNFDSNFCLWKNDLLFSFIWTQRRYDTPSWQTGPSTDHTSGTGRYLYIETSSPRQPGDTARLQSPWMRGPQCMTLFYHMYGATMSCVVIYIKSLATNSLKPVWLRSRDQGDHWIQGKININETSSYQIIVDGIRGSSYKGDAALDDVSFERGNCDQTEETTYYVYSYNGKDFRIFTQPSKHGLYFEEFRFTLAHPRGNLNETAYFIYSEASSSQRFLTSKLDPSGYKKFPLDVVVLSNERVGGNSRSVYLIDRSNYGPMISLHDHRHVICCKGKQTSFYAHNVTEEYIGQARGVLREVWYGVHMDLNRVATMRQHPVFKTPPQNQMILRDFDALVNVADHYVQRLTGYLQVSDTGNYTFYMSCNNWCELWKYDVDEFGIEKQKMKAEENLTKKLIIALYAFTGHLQWNKYQQQISQPIFLDKSRIYQMEVFTCGNGGGDHASVGMRTPSGEYERPISGTRLFWIEPVSLLSPSNMTQSSSVLLPFGPFMAIDRSYATCYHSEKESNPWWQITLKKTLYVESVEITDNIDCCPREIGTIKVTVSTNPVGLDPTCTSSMKYGGKTEDYKFLCSPPARGSYVTVTLTGKNVTLVLCQVEVKTIEFPRQAHGVLRESWYDVNFDMNGVTTMRQHPVYKTPPQNQMILEDFDAPVGVGDYYIQRLTSYLQVPEGGNYTFYLSCDEFCELWKHDVIEDGIEKKRAEEIVAKQPIISVKRFTSHQEWERYPEQISQSVFLGKCRIYRMEAFMREETGNDHISLGMRTPSGEYERPIPGRTLFRTKPGTRKLEVSLQHSKTSLSAFVGSNLRISGFYQFCCEGVYCPDCPLELNISTLGQNVTSNSALNLSCVNTSFITTFNTDKQPGNFTIKVSYSFVNNSEQSVSDRVLGHLHLRAVVIKECHFKSGYCGWISLGDNEEDWKLSNNKTFARFPGYFAYIGDSFKAKLVGSLLQWKPFHQSIGLCLRFNYLMPTQSKPTLKVFLRELKREEQVLKWQLVGNHGEKWSAAQVAWSGARIDQLIFEGEGFVDKTINVAIANIIITTENCPLRPYFAEPGFKCSDDKFTCNNGECVKKNLLCDGDFACKDGSDEDNCECPSSMFNCKEGGCLPATSVCDGINDCSHGDDEKNCWNPCHSRFQCVDGSCISWSKTCTQSAFCRDGTNTPSVCGSGKCHLDDLACTSKNTSVQKRCRSFRGHCDFQSGLCWLKRDKNGNFHWTVGSGQTPTESTGPSYDHTSLNVDGSYIFIEASQRNPGEKARLLSGWIGANETVCVQFWYHMHGSDIGDLNIYVKTNQSETLVWRLSGDQGNRWRFGQTALNSPRLYKFVLEGTVGDGSKGDVAVDDLTILDGICETILKQTSPDCYFEESMCDWTADEGWVLRSYLAGSGKRRGYVSLAAGASDSVSLLSSPVFNIHNYEWKCLRFWYLIHISDRIGAGWFEGTLRVVLDEKTTDQTRVLFFTNTLTHSVRYMQMPLPRNFTNIQIHFEGSRNFSWGPSLAIEDISFSKEPCQQIPVNPGKACQEALGMENGAILDGQITASSQWDENHAPFQGRLHFKKSGIKRGSWSAATSDAYQWLQIDLVSQYNEVTGVATQGRNAFKYQYITKYRLQYSSDEVNFQYYRERGQTADKEFDGNTDEDTVVYHKLIPAIKTRYIRFRPVAWYGEISMRVELYGCKDVSPCDISVDWCGWKSVGGWKRIKYSELDQDYQDHGGADRRDNDDKNDKGISDRSNYEIHLPNIDLGYVSFADVSPLHVGFTLCFWLKTEHSGFFIEYKVATEQNETLVLAVYCSKDTFVFKLENTRRTILMDVADNTWHHVCVLWEIRDELVEVFKDGQRKYVSTGFQSSSQQVGVKGGGTMTIGFREPNASVVLGALTGFDLWSYAMAPGEILSMSHGCGTEAGDVKAWETVRHGLQKEVAVVRPRTCQNGKGDRLVVGTSPTQYKQSAVLVSPVYNRSRDWPSKCLKFRYMSRGPGKQTVTVFHKTDSYREIPIWISKRNTGKKWLYGQVSLSSVSRFQVLIKGEAEKNNSLIALTGLYIDEGTNCTHQPLSAKEACNENLFNMSGYFFSPSFPGYYFGDIYCTWHITVPSGYVIHLEFQEFRLKDHPMCENCFLQIFDGHDKTVPTMGRFCGYAYPPHFISSSNHFTVVLDCQGDLRAVGFKGFYRSVAVSDDLAASCSRQQGCPSSCKCEEFYEGTEKTILVTGKDLVTVPKSLPSNTRAVFFLSNRILRLREMDFTNLAKLEYIDMSFNSLLHTDEHSFQNLPSVNTLRLNSNFFRSLPAGGFTGLPNLRVLDLGWNLLHKASSTMLDGLTSLEVLSLRSNQIEGMEHGVFDNKSNLTHLYLQENKLTTLPSGLFGSLAKLKVLDLSSNQLTTVTKGTFQGLESLEYLYLNSNKLSDVPSDAFSELKNVKYLKLDRFILCCYAKKSIQGVDCESPVDEFSSCDDLMKNKTLQTCIWILGILAFVGNLFVIIWRALDKEENRVQSFLLTNLAVADLLMGVYLMTIAIMDLRWQGEYFMHDIEWRSGIGCRIVGILSMLSSEVSVLILAIITMDRLICIVFPFKFNRLTYRAAVFACIGVWTFGVVISVIPIAGISYFYGDESAGNFGFYSRSAVCLPLQLSGGRPAGWEYSVAFFVCLNFISFAFILVAYITMFWTVKRASRAARSTNSNKESAMAKRLVFIVMTDFCCWMPIIMISILSLTGNFDDPDKIAYVWIAVFVLPLNSSLNPILYTFSTERARRSLTRKRENVSSFAMRTLHSRLPGQKQSVDWLETSDKNTLGTNAIPGSTDSIPLPSPRPEAETKEQDSKEVHAKLKLIEDANILQDDTAGKRSTGYAVAWCEQENLLSMVLLKYFSKEYKQEWLAEVDTVRGMCCDRERLSNLLHYRWHSQARNQSVEQGKVKIRELHSNSLLICYDFVSSSTLEDFLCEKGTVLNFDAVCAIACDVISAIERLQDLGILHNNITTSNILIGQCLRLPPIRAVLGGFSRASKMNDVGAFTDWAADEQSNCSNDIEQFGQLLAILLGHCHGSSEYVKLHEIMNLCFEESVEKRPTASYIRELLEEVWFCVGVWDTSL